MTDGKTSLDQVVAQHLRENPDFLDQHPEILERLQLRHESGVALSLIERQVKLLRQRNVELNRQLKRLVNIASENERLMSRLHCLTLELMSVDSARQFFSQLGESLLNDFSADVVNIVLFDPKLAAAAGDDIRGIPSDDPALEPFRAQLNKKQTQCGRLGDSKLQFLFGSKARWVQSSAVVPVGDKGSDGLMAIGSSDPARFYPGMGTLFLDLLADVVASSLYRYEPQAQRRSA